MTPNSFYYLSAIGFFSVGAYRYFVSPGWNIASFLKTDFKLMLKTAMVTALITYFAHDIAALLPADIMGVTINASDAMAKAPKLAGFAIGAICGGTDALMVLRNMLELVPVIGPKIVMVFSRKPANP